MEIIRYELNDVYEYHCMKEKTSQGVLHMSVQNYRQIDSLCEWGLVPKVVGIQGSIEAVQYLMDYLFGYAKSPILAEVLTKREQQTLEQFGFTPLFQNYLVWDLDGEVM